MAVMQRNLFKFALDGHRSLRNAIGVKCEVYGGFGIELQERGTPVS